MCSVMCRVMCNVYCISVLFSGEYPANNKTNLFSHTNCMSTQLATKTLAVIFLRVPPSTLMSPACQHLTVRLEKYKIPAKRMSIVLISLSCTLL